MTALLSRLRTFSKGRTSWILLLISALFLFFAALWFQHFKQLEPCLICVYIRVAVLGVAVAAAIGLMMPQYIMARLSGLIGWIVASVWGLQESIALVEKQSNSAPTGLFGATCDYIPNFPSWMPLHQWLPDLFQPRGQCGDDAWVWLGFSMAQWMVLVFVLYLVIACVFLISQPFRAKNNKPA